MPYMKRGCSPWRIMFCIIPSGAVSPGKRVDALPKAGLLPLVNIVLNCPQRTTLLYCSPLAVLNKKKRLNSRSEDRSCMILSRASDALQTPADSRFQWKGQGRD